VVVGALTGGIIGMASGLGVVSILYGIHIGLRGGWHCAMEFYDNGLIKGLTFPFRYFKAIIIDPQLHITNVDDRPLASNASYGFHHTIDYTVTKDAAEIILTHTKTVIRALHNDLNVHFPSAVSNIVIQYALSATDNPPIQLTHPMPKLLIRRITLWRENSINNTTIRLPGNTSEVFNSEETCIMIEWNLHSILFPKPKRNQYEEKETENRLTQACGRDNRMCNRSVLL
jgi:hypothetical protein